jgi:hypothetical protein
MELKESLNSLLFKVQLARTVASASESVYEILGGIKRKKLAELRKSEFEYTVRELRELLAYIEKQIKYAENEVKIMRKEHKNG